jgi:DNA-binding MarR family transcriptional regulator
MDAERYDLNESLGFLLNRTAILIKTGLRRAFLEQGHDITPEQWAVLCLLWKEEGLSQSDIADRTIKDRPTVTRIIDGLERRALVRRQRDGRDRRSFRIHLTVAGKALEEDLGIIVRRYRESVFRSLAEAEKAELKRVLNTIYDSLENR